MIFEDYQTLDNCKNQEDSYGEICVKCNKCGRFNIKVYQKAINKFGEEAQIKMAIEEMAELIQALSKFQRGKIHNVEEEIADVKIMIAQLEEMFDKDIISLWEESKLNKLNKLLED